MDKKLTLSLDATVIERAKTYAKDEGTSISKLVENYLAALAPKVQPTSRQQLSPIVKELSGILKLPEDFDPEAARREYLLKKYQ